MSRPFDIANTRAITNIAPAVHQRPAPIYIRSARISRLPKSIYYRVRRRHECMGHAPEDTMCAELTGATILGQCRCRMFRMPLHLPRRALPHLCSRQTAQGGYAPLDAQAPTRPKEQIAPQGTNGAGNAGYACATTTRSEGCAHRGNNIVGRHPRTPAIAGRLEILLPVSRHQKPQDICVPVAHQRFKGVLARSEQSAELL